MPAKLVTINQFFDATEARIAAGFLESEGIPVDIDQVSANSLFGGALGGVRIRVPASHEKSARELLDTLNTAPDSSNEIPSRSSGENSERFANVKARRDLWVFIIGPAVSILLFVLGFLIHWFFILFIFPWLIVASQATRIKCPHCGHPLGRNGAASRNWISVDSPITSKTCRKCGHDLTGGKEPVDKNV